VRMSGESHDRAFDRVIEGKVVKQQKGIETVGDVGAKGAAEQHASTFDDLLRGNDLFNLANGHDYYLN
jgi:hypothetical protein